MKEVVMKKDVLGLLGFVLLAACSAGGLAGSDEASTLRNDSPASGASKVSGASTIISDSFVPLFMSPGLLRGVSYGSLGSNGPTGVLIRDKVPIPGGGFTKYDFPFTASFNVFQVRPATKDSFYLLGLDNVSNGVIEHWSVVPLGTPGAITVAAGSPPLIKVMHLLQERSYTMPTVCIPKAFGVDLEERFVFVVHTPPSGSPTELIKLPLPPNPSGISLVANASTIPLLDTISELYPLTDSVLGRFWTIDGQTPAETVVLLDANNDGVVDNIFTFDYLEYADFHGNFANIVSDGVSSL